MEQGHKGNRQCWTVFVVISLTLFVLTQSILMILDSESHVRLICFSKDDYAPVLTGGSAFCSSKVKKTIPQQNNITKSLRTNSNAIDMNSQISIRDYIVQRYSSPSDTDKILTERNVLIRNLEFAYANLQEMLNRPSRFPSVEQRVKLYMSNWYIPPCDDAARVQYQYSATEQGGNKLTTQEITLEPCPQQRIFELDSIFYVTTHNVAFDQVQYMDRDAFLECKNIYCTDSRWNLLPSFDRLLQNRTGTVVQNSTNVPILVQFGDVYGTRATERGTKPNTYRRNVHHPRMPVFQKVRVSKSASALKFETDDTTFSCYKDGERRINNTFDTLRMEPIVFKVKTTRHYGHVIQGHVVENDHTLWNDKKNLAVFRGALTGGYNSELNGREPKQLTVVDRCKTLNRCWFTYTHASSTLIDAKLTEPYYPNKGIPTVIDPAGDMEDDARNVSSSKEVNLYGKPMNLEELLEYKVLIMLEGNDMSSGLKWALFSSSIVMMPEPTLTSWSMEEMLQPWVHYVPMNIHQSSNGTTTISDAEEKMQWILDNDHKAREIVKASTLWVADLLLHPDEKNDEGHISDEIARRYLTHFVPSQDLV